MKKKLNRMLACALCAVLSVGVTIPALASGTNDYVNQTWSLELNFPNGFEEDIFVSESSGTLKFYHSPSVDAGYDGLLYTLERVSPNESIFYTGDDALDLDNKRVVAISESSVFLVTLPQNVQSEGDVAEDYADCLEDFSVDYLRENLNFDFDTEIPMPNYEQHFAYISSDDNMIRPDDMLTRGETAVMLFTLLVADNKNVVFEAEYSDIDDGSEYYTAVAYLSEYGMIGGYPDGTFRADASLTRAEFVVLLHRFLYLQPETGAADSLMFTDTEGHWATDYLASAYNMGWISGYEDNSLRPDANITLAEAVTVINRMLLRDESESSIDHSENEFEDLFTWHWAYADIMEAAGLLVYRTLGIVDQEDRPVPTGTEVYYYVDEEMGWVVDYINGEYHLERSVNNGSGWLQLDVEFDYEITDIFFFDRNNGILIGEREDGSYTIQVSNDSGDTWHDYLESEETLDKYFPTSQFDSLNEMYGDIVSVDIRPINDDEVYISVIFEKYESALGVIQSEKQTMLPRTDILFYEIRNETSE